MPTPHTTPAIPSETDVVVIGGGISGLTAGALLAKAGVGVCVVEREARPGGCIAGFERKGFRFDTAIHWLNQCGPGGFVHKVFAHIGPDAPRAPPLRRIRRFKGDDFDYLLTSSPDDLKHDLCSSFPDDARSLEWLFREARVLGERLRDYAHLMRASETMSPLERVRRGLVMARWGWPWLKHLRVTAEQALCRRFRSPRLRGVFASEEMLLSVLVPIGWAYTGDYQAAPPGGAQAFATWLCAVLARAGAPVLLHTRVEEVLVAGGKATGVRLAGGRTIKARYVIAAMDVETLFERLLAPGTVSAALVERLRSAELYPSAVTLSLGLDVSPATLGLSEELVVLSRGGQSRADHNGPDPDKVDVTVLAPSVRDPSLAPPGKGTLTVFVPARLYGGVNWHTGPGLARGREYQVFKQAFADKLLDRIEHALVPSLRAHIDECFIATPVTYHRYTGNREGSMMGATPSPHNMRNKVAGYRTPVRNLLLAGHWAEYGGGIPIAVKAASNAVLLVLREASPRGFEELSLALDEPALG